MTGYIYLASPYSHPDPKVVWARYRATVRAAGVLMQRGEVVFSPIAHSHVIAEMVDLPTTWDYWRHIDTVFIERAARLTVFKLDGWLHSVGVQDEILIAARCGVPVDYLEPEDVA